MHTAGQVQTELHRARTQATQPVRGGLRQVQRHDVIIAQRATDNVLGRQLVILLGQTNQTATATLVDAGSLDGNTGVLQRFAGTVDNRLLDAQRRAGATDLYGRIVWIKVGNGVHQADCQNEQNQQVLPQRVFIEHERAARFMTRGAKVHL